MSLVQIADRLTDGFSLSAGAVPWSPNSHTSKEDGTLRVHGEIMEPQANRMSANGLQQPRLLFFL